MNNMSESVLIEKITKATGMTAEEVKAAAEAKRKQLGEMVSIEGALALVGNEKGVKIVDDTEIDIEDVEQTAETPVSDGVTELGLDDLGKKFIKTPKVGEDEVRFTLKKIQRSKDCTARDKDGKTFSTALPSVDYKIVYITSADEEFSPKSWEVVGKLNAICKKLKKIEGLEISAKHIKDGMLKENKDVDKWEIKAKIDEVYKELDRSTNDWK